MRATNLPRLNRCLLDFTARYMRGNVLKNLWKEKDFVTNPSIQQYFLEKNTYFEWYLPLKIAPSSGFIFQPLFLSRLIIKLSLIPKLILSLEKLDAYYFRNEYNKSYIAFL